MPSDSDVEWAQRVLDESAKANGAAVSIDGKTVDRPVVLQAERLMHLARA